MNAPAAVHPRWGRIAGVLLWLLVLVLIATVRDLGDWPRSLIMWATILPAAALIGGDR